MAQAQPTGRACLVELAAGHPAALDDLYSLYAGPAYSLALRMVTDPGRAEVVVQRSFAQIRRCAAQFDSVCDDELTWILRLVRRACLDTLRGTIPGETATLQPDGRSYHPVSTSGGTRSTAAAGQVRAVLAELPAEQQRILQLAYFQGMTCPQIAMEVNLPLARVSQHLRLGLVALQLGLRLIAPPPVVIPQ